MVIQWKAVRLKHYKTPEAELYWTIRNAVLAHDALLAKALYKYMRHFMRSLKANEAL